MKKHFLFSIFFLFSNFLHAENKVVNVFVWGGSIPHSIIQKFEKETGIDVHFSTFDNNETLYAKLRASSQSVYDVIMPSAYYVERLKKQHLLEALNKRELFNLDALSSRFTNNEYDPNNAYSVPLVWGTTGIFYNQKKIKTSSNSWSQLWNKRFQKKLMLLDDSREVFGMTLLTLGYSPNDSDPEHIKQAYEALLRLTPNIKLFANDSLQSVLIDEDAIVGMAWNGDAFKAYQENPAIRFIYPHEGFVIWIDCLAIPKNPPHLKAAHEFINFLMRPDISKEIALLTGNATTNEKAKNMLPPSIRDNPLVYPDKKTLSKGLPQRDLEESTLRLYNEYWEKFKLSF